MKILQKSWLLLSALLVIIGTASPAASQKRDAIPRAEDGYKDAFLSDGKQNYPFELYGVSRDWDARCRKGDHQQCVRLAKAFEEGLGALAKDNRAAIGYYLLACTKGSVIGCGTSAAMLFDRDAGYGNDPLAAEMAKTGCDTLRDQRSCALLGYAHARGLGVARDMAHAGALWDTACGSGADLGCEFKAYSLFNGNADAASGQQAVALFKTACDQQLSWGCAGLSFAHGKGRGVGRDAARTLAFAQQGCVSAKGDTHLACLQYGELLFVSEQPQNVTMGEGFLVTGCRGNNAYACYRVGSTAVFDRRAGQRTTVKEGLYSLRKACDLDYAEGCERLGKAYLVGMGDVAPHPGVTFALWEKACRLGSKNTCTAVKELGDATKLRATVPPIDPSLTVNQQLAKALDLKKQGNAKAAFYALRDLMYEGNDDAEWLLGNIFYYGERGLLDADRAKGLVLIKNAASVGQADAMKWLGYAYWDGTGVPQDRAKAKDYMAYLALKGDREAEAVLRSMNAEAARKAYVRRQAEFAALMERLAQIQASRYAQASAASTSSNSYSSSRSSSSYSGSSSPSLSDTLARVRASNDYYAANVSRAQGRSCPIGNNYC